MTSKVVNLIVWGFTAGGKHTKPHNIYVTKLFASTRARKNHLLRIP